MAAYRPSSPYERPPLRRRASGFALALAVNLGLLLILLGIGKFAPVVPKVSKTIIVDLMSQAQHSAAPTRTKTAPQKQRQSRPVIKPPLIVLPSKPTIQLPPKPPKESKPLYVEMSHDELTAADIGNLPKGGSSDGDSEAVGRGPNGETLYAAEWARHPTDAELGTYLPRNAPDGAGIIACKTIPGERVDDCVEIGNDPPGSHLASAVRQAAWQFRVRPPRLNGRPMIGEWVEIRIDYIHTTRSD